MSDLLFRNAHVVDGMGDTALESTDVLVHEGRIVEIGTPGHRLTARHDADVLDLRGLTLMPGLIDAHVHVTAVALDEDIGRPMPASLRAQHAAAELEAMLGRGFTTVRDAGGADAGYRRAIELGLIDGPRLLVAGHALSQTGGHGDDRTRLDVPLPHDAVPGSFGRVVDGVENVRLAARIELGEGADQIKLCISGGVLSPNDPLDTWQFSEEEIRAAVAEAEAHGTYVMAHAYGAGAIARGVRCGVRTFEHGNLIDADAARLVADAGGFVVPNLVAYDAMARHGREFGIGEFQLKKLNLVMEAAQTAFGIMRAASVQVGFGTDLQGPIWPHQSEEFRLRSAVDAPADIVRSATSVNADLIRRPDLGRIAVGATADLLVVDGDPLVDAAVLAAPERAVQMVITEGRVRRGHLRSR